MDYEQEYDVDKLFGYMKYLEEDRDNNRRLIILVRQRIETIMATRCIPTEFEKRIATINEINGLLDEIKNVEDKMEEFKRRRRIIHERMQFLINQ